ncbi:MAG: ABC transporter permease [Bacillota bacterium]|nr:ABC transporter permease [Bacillota bacterium]
MRKNIITYLMISTGIFMLYAGIVLGNSIINKAFEANGAFSMDKVVVSLKNQIDPLGENILSEDDIKKLTDFLKTSDISYTAQPGVKLQQPINENSVEESAGNMVLNGQTSYPVKLLGTNSEYADFSNVTLKYGSFFSKKSEEEGAATAVIDTELAWTIFKTDNAIGKTINIYGEPFSIIGILKKDTSILNTLNDDGKALIYIPAQKLMELDKSAGITSFQIRLTDNINLDQNSDYITDGLQQIGKIPDFYEITDYSTKKLAMEQKPLIIVFIPGCITIIILLLRIKKVIQRKIYYVIREGCKTDYFSKVVKDNKNSIVSGCMEVFIIAVCMLILWYLIRFNFYISPKSIPEELIDISYYAKLIKSGVQSNAANLGFIPSMIEQYMHTAGALLDAVFWISIITGLFLFYTGMHLARLNNIEPYKLSVFCALTLFASAVLLLFADNLLGLPYSLQLRSVIALWAFIYIAVNNERRIKNV